MSVGLEPRAGGARERGTPPGDGSRRKVAERLAVLGQREIIRRARVHGMGSNAVAGRGADCRDWNIGWKAELLDEGGQLGLAATRRNDDIATPGRGGASPSGRKSASATSSCCASIGQNSAKESVRGTMSNVRLEVGTVQGSSLEPHEA